MHSTSNSRPRRRSTAAFSVIAATVVLIPAGLANAGSPRSAPPASAPPTLPEGVYLTEPISLAQLAATGERAGFDPARIEQLWSGDGMAGTLSMGIRVTAGGFTELWGYDGAEPTPGLRGTWDVVDADTIVIATPGVSVTFDFVFDGTELTLDFIDIEGEGTSPVDEMFLTTSYESAPFVYQGPPEEPSASSRSYTSSGFVVPFEVTLPEWVDPTPAVEDANFVTWEGTTVDRGIRFLVPVSVVEPGSTTESAVPADYDSYLAFLMGQRAVGGDFADVVETTVDGHAATLLTAVTTTSLDGSIGCQAEGLPASDCFGLQPDLVLRMAVIDTGAVPLLVWVRDIAGDGSETHEYDSFDAMLATLRLTP